MVDERAVEIRDALLHAAMLGIARQRRVADEAVERVARTWLVNGLATVDSGGFSNRTLWECLNESTHRIAELEAALATAVAERQRVEAAILTGYETRNAHAEGWANGYFDGWPLDKERRAVIEAHHAGQAHAETRILAALRARETAAAPTGQASEGPGAHTAETSIERSLP